MIAFSDDTGIDGRLGRTVEHRNDGAAAQVEVLWDPYDVRVMFAEADAGELMPANDACNCVEIRYRP